VIAYLIDWLSLFGRWVHLITGIAWIGSSFYFVWLDNHLRPPADPELSKKGVGGELWSVHGGGFYNAHKYKVAPEKLPGTLHWFYWEAYSTFLSGLFLLCLLYFGQAEIYLIDPSIAALTKPAAITIAVAFLVGGWLLYDALCRTPLARNGMTLGVVLSVLLAIAAWGLCSLFSGRGAYIVFGAMLGTIMVANVFFVIIPGQREMVRAKQEEREPDPSPGIKGKLRSTHNTYFTLPVLFTMISNHYAVTYGANYNWLVLLAISAAGVLIRVYFVARHKAHEREGRTSLTPAIIGVALLALVAFALMPKRHHAIADGAGDAASQLRSRASSEAGADIAAGRPRASQAEAGATSTNSAEVPASGNAHLPMAGDASASTASRAQSTDNHEAQRTPLANLSEFQRVQLIFKHRCVSCHSARPTQPGFIAAPSGVLLDTPERILVRLPQIHQQVFARTMPVGNLTGLTEEERAQMLAWIERGAPR
jgi:uncharacterized membrane protein